MTPTRPRLGANFPRTQNALSLSGQLFDEPDPVPEPHQHLLAAAHALHAGHGTVPDLVAAFRAATLLVPVVVTESGLSLMLPRRSDEDLHWLVAFSSASTLAAFFAPSSPTQPVRYGTPTGEQLLDTYLPQLPRGTAVLLDAGAEHTVALPPVTGIVPDRLALDHDQDQS
ncbi:hypothetical protein GCM10011581_08300 [Saccharopolyspora subtropica]|uniref:SseB protein N-terminal domain-containing protein n=1 Tax=Saccharopolyspora thermophila TaxID=89367 RepID=A0A917JKL1_9PSEU|nr:SseB family protein [Saccharopolyspora subtropica]GGI73630.1 hypothetical protein GCM10011581_08300 [Saccharopolyspora subtropica]